ncbi:uncharacterized protein LOC119677231 [Teleopsis dalmanni]|uniref:uncharacterized protein LOC119677231 n=1 Tax=Teleopsis dalmanni TaxID=139649 RepID=UPI0018CE1672|nr:uncharacterized protein LOC119677231 [Teleopsis dalmanni]
MPDDSEAPIAFGSRTLQGAKRNYSQLDKEALAIMFGVQKFHQFLSGRQFTIMTDHKPLVGLFNPEKPISQHISPRMLRWSLKLGAYQYEIKFREGKHHQNADALSRLPLNDVKLQIPEIPEILYCNEAEEQFLITAKDIAQATRRDPVLSKKMQSSDINKNLANILLHLRTTPNANSNSSPAEILMRRKLKTLLDHLHPSDDNTQKQLNSDEYSKQIKPVRSFQCSKSVWYRNFGRGEKWMPGIIQSTGDRNYKIQSNSNILSRHIDQLHKRVSETPTSLESNITPVTVTSVAQPEEQDDQVSPGHSSNEYILPDSQVEGSLEEKDKRDETLKSRPYRQRQPPKRLRDYLMGEEL